MISALPAIGLDELLTLAPLMTRVDRKYLIPAADVPVLIDAFRDRARVLEIGRRREFAYRSTYFDSPGLVCYLDSARRRRRRFKVRIRSYVDTGQHYLEVKTRGPRGSTVKQRAACAGPATWLDLSSREFVQAVLARARIADNEIVRFGPTLSTSYRRTTLFVPAAGSRVTVDTELAWTLPGGATLDLPALAVVETKSPRAVSDVDRLLWSLRHRPRSISKYATGLAALRPDLPAHRWQPLLRRHF